MSWVPEVRSFRKSKFILPISSVGDGRSTPLGTLVPIAILIRIIPARKQLLVVLLWEQSCFLFFSKVWTNLRPTYLFVPSLFVNESTTKEKKNAIINNASDQTSWIGRLGSRKRSWHTYAIICLTCGSIRAEMLTLRKSNKWRSWALLDNFLDETSSYDFECKSFETLYP